MITPIKALQISGWNKTQERFHYDPETMILRYENKYHRIGSYTINMISDTLIKFGYRNMGTHYKNVKPAWKRSHIYVTHPERNKKGSSYAYIQLAPLNEPITMVRITYWGDKGYIIVRRRFSNAIRHYEVTYSKGRKIEQRLKDLGYIENRLKADHVVYKLD